MGESPLKMRKAQHLVEFAFVVPILMLVIFVIIEIGMAINARMTVSEAVKSALVKVNNLNNLGGSVTGSDKASKINLVRGFIGSEVVAYLIQHNIPNSGSVDVQISVSKDDYATVLVSYEYNPIFILPGMGKIIPDTYKFSSSQTLNPHVFQSNVFPNNRTTEQLSLYNQRSFDDFIDSGELVDNEAREYTAFLVQMYELYSNFDDPAPATSPMHARLISWEGYDLLPPNLRINVKTGTLEVRSPYYITDKDKPWIDTKIPYIWAVTALGINHLIYVKYNTDRMKIEDKAGLYYKLRLGDTNSFYNLDIPTCTQVGNCGSSLLAGGDTINERAIRLNPRIGKAPLWIDTYITGTMEPVKVYVDAGNTPIPFEQVNSPYFSYTRCLMPFMKWILQMLIKTLSSLLINTGLNYANPAEDVPIMAIL
jgi:hypothetical protein